MSAVNFIISLARKILARESKGITKIPTQMAAEAKAGEIAARLQDAGLPLNRADEFIKSEQDLVRILNMIESTPPVMREVPSGIRNTEKGKVFDMQGKEIPPGSRIMGGEEVVETEAEILERLKRGNKETVEKIKQRKFDEALKAEQDKMLKDEDYIPDIIDPDDFAQGGRAGFKAGLGKKFLELLKNKKMFRSKDDVPTSVFSEKTGPITIEDMANIPEDQLRKIRRTQELGLYTETPEILKAGNLFERFTKKVGGKRVIDYDRAEFILNRKLKGNETLNDLLQIEYQTRPGRAEGGRIGYFMGGPNPKGLGLLRQVLNYMSKKGVKEDKFKGVDLSGLDMLRLSNPKAFNKMLEDVRGKVNVREGIMGTDTVRAQQEALRAQRKGLTEKSLDVAKAMKADDDKIKIRLAKEAETTIIPKVKKSLMEGMGMSEEAAEKAARNMAEAAQNIKPIDAPPKITDEGILQLENVLKNMETGGKKKRDLNATGGRIGFKDGMSRRTFLKLLGGLASIPIIGKIVKPIKLAKGVKNVPIIKTENVAGKPEWFDALVNKVIIEGDDVTKTFATGERQSIHQKRLDDGSVVRVTEDIDDGAVRVEYESETNVFGDTATMEYKKPLPDEGAPDPAAEFSTAESGPVGRQVGPDDYDIDVDEVGGSSISDLDSDVSKLKEYATGQKLTMKEFIQSKKRKDKVKAITADSAAEAEEVVRRQGDYDPFASGGIARMLGE